MWYVEFGGLDPAASLRSYSLRTLYVSNPAARKASGLFPSSAIAHMCGLQLLSLRGYATLELDRVPSSVHTLQVGPAHVVKELSHR